MKIGSNNAREKWEKKVGWKRIRSNRVLAVGVILNYCEGRKRRRIKDEIIDITSNSNLSESEENINLLVKEEEMESIKIQKNNWGRVKENTID